jgi:hypothetical protein
MREMNRFCGFGSRHCFLGYAAIPALVFILSIRSLPAQFMVLPTNLTYLAQRADIIVQGRVTEVRHECLPGYPNIPTVLVTLQVEKTLRGSTGSTYTFREIFLGLRSREGKQSYVVGQRLFLFLPSPSQYGLSSPVGIEQGRFHIAGGSAGGAMIANEHGNAGLFKDVERDANRAGIQLTRNQSRLAATKGGPVALDEFVGLVKSLTALPRIK